LVVGHFAYYVFVHWYNTPRDSTYQRYSFVRGAHRYEVTLEEPGHGFDISDVTNQPHGTTTSLLMGDYQERHDTIFMREWAGLRQYFIYHHTLVGFENGAKPISLTREHDILPFTLW
jgi:hypothetical protein